MADREVIARLHNCIVGMADQRMMLFDTSILYAFESSQKYTVSIVTFSACRLWQLYMSTL